MIPTAIKAGSVAFSCSCGSSPGAPSCSYQIPTDDRTKIADSLGDFTVQILLCSGISDVKWPKRMSKDFPIILQLKDLAHSIKNCPEIKLTVTDIPSETPPNSSAFDFLIFPHGWKVKNISSENASEFVQLLSKFQPTFDPITQAFRPINPEIVVDSELSSSIENLYSDETKDYFFVCTHHERDYRCGQLGSLVRYCLEKSPLAKNAVIASTSHIGGHKYAGNIVHYPLGDFFGYIDETSIPQFVKVIEQLSKAPQVQTIEKLNFSSNWRGRVGHDPDSDSDSETEIKIQGNRQSSN